MAKSRILFIAPLPPPVHGSAMVSQYIKDSQLLQSQHDCDFVNLSTSRRMDEIGKGGAKKLFRFVGSYFAVLFKLLTRRYDLCYLAITCHGMGFLKDAPFVLLCKLFGRKVLIHQHNKGMSRYVERWPYRWLLPLVYRHTKVMLLSWHLYDDISRVVKRDQVVICPNGIPQQSNVGPLPNPLPKRGNSGIAANTKHYTLNTKQTKNENCHPNGVSAMSAAPSPSGEGWGEATPHLLFLSNLIPSKGVYVLLDACRMLHEQGLSFVCDFVGGETKEIDRATFDAAVKERGLEGIARYQGPKYGEEKERCFAEADIFVFPTFYYNECFPLVLLEAMQYQLPLVSTNEGGIPDIIQHGVNGYTVEREEAAPLAEALAQLITHPTLRHEMGTAGYARYKELYTLEAFERQFVSCLVSCER